VAATSASDDGPTKKLEVNGGTALSGANDFALKLKGAYAVNNWTGILFGATFSDSYNKGGIISRQQMALI